MVDPFAKAERQIEDLIEGRVKAIITGRVQANAVTDRSRRREWAGNYFPTSGYAKMSEAESRETEGHATGR